MHTDRNDDVIDFWNRVASDWDIQVGEEGDNNRQLNSDPVLWRFAGIIKGLKVLDAGCGTGYLSRKLHRKGAIVTGIDISYKMIEIAKKKSPGITCHVDSCSTLTKLEDNFFDLIIANYVLMDTPDLEATMKAFNRVLKPGGAAVVIFSHPCFPQGRATVSEDRDTIGYNWDFPYFDRCKRVDPPWGHFKSDFIWFHRSLSDYWKAFKQAGFTVDDMEEPRITKDRYHHAGTAKLLNNSKTRPYSIAFRLVKKPQA
ncbi:MAG: methyltransferase domain-containing protein [Victivallales bacterium]